MLIRQFVLYLYSFSTAVTNGGPWRGGAKEGKGFGCGKQFFIIVAEPMTAGVDMFSSGDRESANVR